MVDLQTDGHCKRCLSYFMASITHFACIIVNKQHKIKACIDGIELLYGYVKTLKQRMIRCAFLFILIPPEKRLIKTLDIVN